MGLRYPNVKRVEVEDNYHGMIVKDPYRYMEDPDDPETLRFVKENNVIVENFIDKQKLQYFMKKMDQNSNFTKHSVPMERNGKYIYWKQTADQKQCIYYIRDGWEGEETKIFDVNMLSTDGTTSVINFFVNPDAKYFVASISVFGSDWLYFHIQEIESGKVLERLDWMTITELLWDDKGEGFYYPRFPDQSTVLEEDKRKHQKLYYHKLGTSQNNDIMVYDPKDKLLSPEVVTKSEGTGYLFLIVTKSTLPENKLLFRNGSGEFQAIVDEFDGHNYYVVGIHNDQLFIRTSWNAPNQRIMAIDLTNPNRENWREIIPETDHLLESVQVANAMLLVKYQENVKHKLQLHNLDGNFIRQIELPGTGALDNNDRFEGAIWAKSTSKEVFYGFTNFLYPITIFRYDIDQNMTEMVFESELKIKPDDFEVNQVFYSSKDGTKIPMYIVHKKGLKLNGNNPTLLYGYGGYDISLMPAFAFVNYTWINEGYVFVQANLRGGGEYGKKWHEQALLGNKQNVFDDFIAAAEWLISNNYTSKKYLAINGRSNGGLLVGACITQRPDLYGAAIPQVGVLDMLRYPIQQDAGRYWTGEYGDAINNQDHFEFLIKFSPYHNVAKQMYPPVLITAAEHDDRVAPMHSKKFGATLQHANQGKNPILVRIETKAGHGFGKPRQKIIEDYAINLAFIATVMRI